MQNLTLNLVTLNRSLESAKEKGEAVHSTNWLHWAWPLILILGLTPLSCATQVGKRPAILSDTRPRTLDSELQTAKQPDATTKTKLQVTYAKVPLHFEPNEGQTDEQVHFLSRGSGYTLFLTATEAVLALRKPYDDSHNSLAPVPDSFSSPLPWRERIKERGSKIEILNPWSKPSCK